MQEVMAFSDCELPNQERLHMLDRIASDGELAKRIKHQKLLREAVCKCMADDPACRCPEELKNQIQQMVMADAAHPEQAADQTQQGVIGYVGRWMPAAVAAVLFISAVVVMYGPGDGATGTPMQAGAGSMTQLVAGLMPRAQVDMFEKRHVGCATNLALLKPDGNLPNQVESLPAALSERFSGQVDGLDLSGIGYKFERVGKCTVPGQAAVHLVYRALPETGRADAISLWLLPASQADVTVKEGQVYRVNGAGKAHPLVLWRHGGMMYYLVGDSMDVTERAAQTLRNGV